MSCSKDKMPLRVVPASPTASGQSPDSRGGFKLTPAEARLIQLYRGMGEQEQSLTRDYVEIFASQTAKQPGLRLVDGGAA